MLMFLGSPGKTIQVDFRHLGIILPGFHLPSQRAVEVLHILQSQLSFQGRKLRYYWTSTKAGDTYVYAPESHLVPLQKQEIPSSEEPCHWQIISQESAVEESMDVPAALLWGHSQIR